ncbi:hypothetical protein Ahy_A03g010551 [Arachis hypogaea]|uniref:Uncharacterized protein n=1 Tax=Arachis hypogaea TaxID=3818 RepID=A0A445DMI0_ARAHY|nr:hypothetical protein Ahy_A03g010551 [Arachis hypogaea]
MYITKLYILSLNLARDSESEIQSRGSIGTSPYKLVYGHDAVLPQDDLPVDDNWNAMYDELNDVDSEHVLALENMIRQKENVARNFNCRIKEKYFGIGELVLKVVLPIKKKSRFLGHFQVIELYSGNTYRIKNIDYGNVINSINKKYLKKYQCMPNQD